jgi:Tol biopolymer transport system component/DNA-binding winged helix-turn-helix (wHTH) protein
VASRLSPVIRFGAFAANTSARELRKDGVRLKLQDQPFRVLEALLEKPGEVVTREELQERIWGEDTYVDFDKSLSAAVNKVRQALDDSRTRPRFIETIPKVGYRFIGEIESAPYRATEPPEPVPLRPNRVVWALAAALLAALVGFTFWMWKASNTEATAPVIASPPVQLTAYPGEERQPAFSPDGSQVVFTRRERDREDYDIWVKFVGQEEAIQLTFDPADEMSPAWSPDGSRIAFLRHKPGGLADVVLISPHGAGERTLTEIFSRAKLLPSTLTWSPDGSRLLTFQRFDSGGEVGIFTISVDSGARERLLDVSARTPSYSPNGETIAFLLGTSRPYLALMPSAGGSVRNLGHSIRNPGRSPIPWTTDGSGLIGGQPLSIYSLDGGVPVPLAAVGGDALEPALSPATGRLAYSAGSLLPMTTWLLDVQAPGAPPAEFAPTSRGNGNPQFSDDDKQVVFTSDRSGKLAVWVANLDGTSPRQLTSTPIGGTPRWSPEGAEVGFDGPGGAGASEIFAVPSFGGSPRRITTGPTHDNVPSYSNDGRWVYFASNRSGEWQTYRVAVEGEEQRPDSVRQMTQGGGYAAFESPDGRYLFYAKQRILAVGEPNSLWRVPLEGGAEEVVIEDLYSSWSNWALAGDSVYFLNPRDEHESPGESSSWAIYKLNLTTRERTRIAPIEGQPFAGPSFDVSHDERWILYSTVDPPESDLMLVEDFR